MNIYKYAIPASIAATVHVALLSLAPEPTPLYIEVPLANPPHISDPPPQPPEEPEDRTTAEEPVKALLGEPAPVALDEPIMTPVKTEFTIQHEDPRPEVTIDSRKIPATVGDPLGDPNGKFRPPSSIFDVRSLDREPRAKVQIPPDYPYAMKQSGTEGRVVVEFDVDISGRVTRAEATSYSDREFVEAAVRAVRKWRFEPGRRDGKAVPFRMTIPIEFGMEKER